MFFLTFCKIALKKYLPHKITSETLNDFAREKLSNFSRAKFVNLSDR